jgi:hypothetical protein
MPSVVSETALSLKGYPEIADVPVRRSRRSVPAAALGLNGLAVRLLWMQAAALVATIFLFAYSHLTVQWTSLGATLFGDGLVVAIWVYLYFDAPGRPRTWILAETMAVLVLIITLSQILCSMQYPAAALGRPLIDPILASADAILGINVESLAQWTRAHPTVSDALSQAYFTLLWQFALVIPALGILLRDRDALWEYAFHYHFCLLVALAAFILWPAACAFQYYGFESTIDQTRFIHHFNALRDGSMTVVRMNDIEGLVSVPSFHVAGALMISWAFRRRVLILVPVTVVNCALIAATFMSGAHYVVDALLSLPLFAASIFVYRKWAAPLHRISDRPAECAGYAVEMR